jgi:flagellar biogenesis protein FliO
VWLPALETPFAKPAPGTCLMISLEPKHRTTKLKPLGLLLTGLFCVAVSMPAAAATTNLFSSSLNSSSLPDAGPSLLRVLGALALVLGLFLGGVWLVRNGRFTCLTRGRTARLNVLETRSLGARQALYVVGYGQERFLIGSTPAGINLLSHLASSSESDADLSSQPAANMSFSQALSQVLRGQKSAPGKPGGPS